MKKKNAAVDPVFPFWGSALARERFDRHPGRNTKPEDLKPGPVKKIKVTDDQQKKYQNFKPEKGHSV